MLAAAPSNVARAILPSAVAPAAASAAVAFVAAFAAAVCVVSSSALPSPIQIFSTFQSSPLGFSAFTPQSLSTPASAVVPGVALWHLRK